MLEPKTVPSVDTPTDLTFYVMICQGYKDRGNEHGYPIYPTKGQQNPAFAVLTGDLVYYDNDPTTVTDARLVYTWEPK